MAFKSIGTLAGTVLKQAELMAGGGHYSTRNLGGPANGSGAAGPMGAGMALKGMGGGLTGEESINPPFAQASLEEPMASKLNEKVRGTSPAVQGREGRSATKRNKPRVSTTPALVLIVSNDGRWHPMPPQNGFPRPGQRPSLRMIVGGLHATYPSWGI